MSIKLDFNRVFANIYSRLFNDVYSKLTENISFAEPASYIIFTDGSKYYAKNGGTGVIEYSDADATKVIQFAIDKANAVGGGKVFIREGTYILSTSIYMKSNVVLEGAGTLTLLKLKDNATGGATIEGRTKMFVIGGKVNNVVLRNFKIDGNKANQSEIVNGIWFRYSENIVIENLTIENMNGPGIALEPARKILVLGCRVINTASTGIIVGDFPGDTFHPEDIIIVDNYVDTTGPLFPDGIAVGGRPVNRAVIANNVVKNAGDVGIEVQTLDSGNIGYDFIVEGNIVINSDKVGISVNGSNGGVIERFSVHNNIVDTAKLYGINIVNANNGDVSLNVVYNIPNPDNVSGAGVGIRIKDSNRIDVIGNKVLSTESVGFSVGGSLNKIIANYMENTSTGIYVAGSNHVVAFNIFKDPKTPRHSVMLDGATYVLVFNNMIVNNNGYAQGISESGTADYNVIMHNDVKTAVSPKISKVGANTVVKYNIGYYTEKSGVATIPAGSTRVTVSHGLIQAPSKVLITPLGQPLGKLWVENITSTSFDIVTDTAPTADLNVSWQAEV